MASNEQDQQQNDVPLQSKIEEKKEELIINDNYDEEYSNLKCRKIIKKFKAHSQKEGAGFIVHRPIGGLNLNEKESDPFLMLDELGPKMYKKGEFEGAPWHPHRGFDTVMYMKSGEGKHQDSMGTSGILNAGDVQWMTAGSGIIHDEGKDHPGGLLHGFQLWVNLPKKHKMIDPCYKQLTEKHFPFLQIGQGVKVKVIAGEINYFNDKEKEWKLQKSPLKPIVPINYFDYNMEKGENIHKHVITKNMRKIFKTAIIYVYEGEGYIANGGNKKWTKVTRTDTLKLSEDGDCIDFMSSKDTDFGFLLLLGQPIKEPIAWRGPFVMNTEQEIMQCFVDYRNGKLATVKGQSIIY